MSNASRGTKQFVVGSKADGADFDTAEIDAIIYKVAMWFGKPESGRASVDAVAEATTKIQQCLLGTKEDGSFWQRCPAAFADRVRIKCGFDIINNKGIPQARVKNAGGGIARDPAAEKAAKALTKGNPILAGFDQEAFRADTERNILTAFPELDNPAHLPGVRSLCLYYAQREVIDRELAAGVNANARETLLKSLKVLSDMAQDAMKQLGIHPDQVRKKISDKGASTVADLVAVVDTDDEFRRREKIWTLQLALQLWWMSEHHNGRRDGPQVHDFEIWHMTRSRPVKFKCRHGEEYLIVEGFEPKELHDYLVKEGVLVEQSLIPGLVDTDALKGLSNYFVDDTPEQTIPEEGADAPEAE